HLRRPGSWRLTGALVALPALATRTTHGAVARPARSRTSGCAGILLGRSARPAIRIPARKALQATRPCRNFARSSYGAWQDYRAAEAGDPATLQGSRLYAQSCGRYLWRRIAKQAGAGGQVPSSCPLVERLWLLPAGDRRIGLDQSAVAAFYRPADTRLGGNRRSNRASRQRTHSSETDPGCAVGDSR